MLAKLPSKSKTESENWIGVTQSCSSQDTQAAGV